MDSCAHHERKHDDSFFFREARRLYGIMYTCKTKEDAKVFAEGEYISANPLRGDCSGIFIDIASNSLHLPDSRKFFARPTFAYYRKPSIILRRATTILYTHPVHSTSLIHFCSRRSAVKAGGQAIITTTAAARACVQGDESISRTRVYI